MNFLLFRKKYYIFQIFFNIYYSKFCIIEKFDKEVELYFKKNRRKNIK